MTVPGLAWFVIVLTGVFLYVMVSPSLISGRVQSGGPRQPRGEDRGGIMDQIARWVVLALGRITFAALCIFKKLGVDMATVDETLASWTAWSLDIKERLTEALADAQNLRDTDAIEDAAAANALSETLAAKIQAAYDAATSSPAPPETEAPTEEEPPVEEEEPVEEEPVV